MAGTLKPIFTSVPRQTAAARKYAENRFIEGSKWDRDSCTSENGLRKPFQKVTEEVVNAKKIMDHIDDGGNVMPSGFIKANKLEISLLNKNNKNNNKLSLTAEENINWDSYLINDIKDDTVIKLKEENILEPNLLEEEKDVKSVVDMISTVKQGSQTRLTGKKVSPNPIFAPWRIEMITNGVYLEKQNIKIILTAVEEHHEIGKDIPTIFKYVFYVEKAKKWVNVVVDAMKLDSIKWLKEALQGLVYMEPDEIEKFKITLIKAIETASVPRYSCFASNGWYQIDGKLCYVLSEGVVGNKSFPARGLEDYKFPPLLSNNRAAVYRNVLGMQNICRTVEYMTILILYTQASFLSTLYELAGFPLKFIIALVGETNSRKTTLAMMLGKIFNRNIQNPDASFLATLGGIRELVYKHADQVLIVDDIRPGVTPAKNREQSEKVEELAVLYGDRVSKKYMKSYQAERKTPIRGGCIITGEYIDGSESSYARRIQLNLDRLDVHNEVLLKYQQNDIWPTYIYEMLDYVSENSSTIIEKIRRTILELRITAGFKIGRRNEQYSQLCAMAQIMTDYGLYCGAITIEEKRDLDAIMSRHIALVLSWNEQENNILSPAMLMVKALTEELNTCNEVFSDCFGKNSARIYQDEKFYYISIVKLIEITTAYCRKVNQPMIVLGEKAVAKILDNEALILTKQENGGVRRSHKLPGFPSGSRYLYINKQKVNQYLQKIEEF